jgi:cellulose synthase (UDP-forming)
MAASSGTTLDFSQKGIGLRLPAGASIARNARIEVTLFRNEQEKVFPAVVVFSRNDMVGAQFHELTLRQQSELVRLTFSRADIWANNWGKSRPRYAPESLARGGRHRHERREATLQGHAAPVAPLAQRAAHVRSAAPAATAPALDNTLEKQ